MSLTTETIFETLNYAIDREATDSKGYTVTGDALALITINRPDKHNALNEVVLRELSAALSMARYDEDIKGVIITGMGQRSFVAGADIAEFRQLTPLQAQTLATKGQGVLNQVAQMPKPVLAAVNGFALGGGCELALACHLRIASEQAVFGQPELNLGLIPGYGGTQRLPRIVGLGIATEMILTGKPIDAQRAYGLGMVSQVVPQKDLLSAAKKMLRTVTARAPLGIRMALEALQASELPLAHGLQLEATLFGQIVSSKDFSEGVGAFLEKRTPHFTGE
ncbi:MAG TPA: enoyl-CoA hydratase-related protein [Rhodothermales bacterium]|nr:enoyl-CoA hydratase-related protein [Rhodothermales bacterium]